MIPMCLCFNRESAMCGLCKASVMIYNDKTRKWETAGKTPGLFAVCIYVNSSDRSYRVVGRKEQDGEVCI